MFSQVVQPLLGTLVHSSLVVMTHPLLGLFPTHQQVCNQLFYTCLVYDPVHHSQNTGYSPLSLASRSVHHWFLAVLGTTNWILALIILFCMLTTSTIRTRATRNITNSRVTPMCASNVCPVPSRSSFTQIATLMHRRRASLA